MSGLQVNTSSTSGIAWRYTVLTGLLLSSLVLVLSLPAIPQDLAYHELADRRVFAGIPNALDVLSNLAFLAVGLAGLRFCTGHDTGEMRWAWMAFFAGVALVGLGSAWYHWNPTNDTLVWDRLPMTVAFMAVFVALIGECLQARFARLLLAPAIIVGAASVAVWAWTDDLRFYAWVQFAPLVLLPVVLALFRSRYTGRRYLGLALGWYVLAKVTEFLDVPIFAVTGDRVSGHTLKHLLAAAGCYSLLLMLRNRGPR